MSGGRVGGGVRKGLIEKMASEQESGGGEGVSCVDS